MSRLCSLAAATLILCSAYSNAQTPPTPEQPWSTRPVVRIWPGVAPGSEHDTRKETMTIGPGGLALHIVRNVTTPTLTIFQPKLGNSTGTAVLICPGGAFRILAIDEEGYQVADWFSQHGVTAFVLKYRVAETPANDAEFAPPGESMEEGVKRLLATLPKDAVPNALADGVQALKIVRASAVNYGFKPDHVVALGFSAGGGVVTGTASASNAADRPNFVAPIYGALFMDMPVPPADAPPFFLAMAEDDPLVQPLVMRLFTSLRESGGKPEFHLYRAGEHGFSMKQRGTSDHWLQELWWWMGSYGLTGESRN